jgi:hypothetical protein
MNSVYLLILWSAFLNNGRHDPTGAITVAPFATSTHCEFALKSVRDTAKNINGVCVPQGSSPDSIRPGKSGPILQVLTGRPD